MTSIAPSDVPDQNPRPRPYVGRSLHWIGSSSMTRAEWEDAWTLLVTEMASNPLSPAAFIAAELAAGPWGAVMAAAA